MARHLILLCMLVFGWAAALAQPLGGPPGRPSERIEQWKKIRLVEMLDMKEEVSVRFFARMNDHEKAKRELLKERDETLDRVERLVRVEAPSAEFEKAFAELAAVDARIAAGEKAFFDSLSDILTIEQRAKMVLFERRFEGELREAMKEQFRRRRAAPLE